MNTPRGPRCRQGGVLGGAGAWRGDRERTVRAVCLCAPGGSAGRAVEGCPFPTVDFEVRLCPPPARHPECVRSQGAGAPSMGVPLREHGRAGGGATWAIRQRGIGSPRAGGAERGECVPGGGCPAGEVTQGLRSHVGGGRQVEVVDLLDEPSGKARRGGPPDHVATRAPACPHEPAGQERPRRFDGLPARRLVRLSCRVRAASYSSRWSRSPGASVRER